MITLDWASLLRFIVSAALLGFALGLYLAPTITP